MCWGAFLGGAITVLILLAHIAAMWDGDIGLTIITSVLIAIASLCIGLTIGEGD